MAVERTTKAINRAFVGAASAIALAVVFLVLYAVLMRFFGQAVLWPQDVAQFALAYIFFLALAPALESGHHVTADLFEVLIPRPIRPYMLHVAAVLTVIFGAVLMWQLWKATARAFSDNRLAVSAIAVPLKWIYLAGPIGTLQFILTALVDLGRAHWAPGKPATAPADH